jgi:hypothetical protein
MRDDEPRPVWMSLLITHKMRDGQTSPHRPRLVVSRSTCPPISPPPPCKQFCTRSCSNKHTHTLRNKHTHTHSRSDTRYIECIDMVHVHIQSVLRLIQQRWQPLEDGRWGRVVGREGAERYLGEAMMVVKGIFYIVVTRLLIWDRTGPFVLDRD